MMHTIFGENIAEERIRKDNMQPNNRVAIDHDFYSANPERASKKMKEVEEKRNISGLEMGFGGRIKPDGKDYDKKRSKHALGGAAKWRQEFEGI